MEGSSGSRRYDFVVARSGWLTDFRDDRYGVVVHGQLITIDAALGTRESISASTSHSRGSLSLMVSPRTTSKPISSVRFKLEAATIRLRAMSGTSLVSLSEVAPYLDQRPQELNGLIGGDTARSQ